MCNVYAMYSFEPELTPDGTLKPAPLQSCWDDQSNKMSR